MLLTSFGLDADRGLQRLAAMVHALDVGGAATPEAGGFDAVLVAPANGGITTTHC